MKKVRVILPAIAILFAVVGAFATVASPMVLQNIEVSLTQSPCDVDGVCNTDVTGTTCDASAGSTLYIVSATTPCQPLGAVGGTFIP